MSDFVTIDQLPYYNNWNVSAKFKSINTFVDERGEKIASHYSGRVFELVCKREREFSSFERLGRAFLGTMLIVCSFGTFYFSKYLCHKVQILFTKSKKSVHFGKLVKTPDSVARLDHRIQQFLNDQTFRKYCKLPEGFKYLIAGRYYYNYFLWSFDTKSELVERFKNKFKEKDLSSASTAIAEAVQAQCKINALEGVLNTTSVFSWSTNTERSRKLKALDEVTYAQLKSCLQRKLIDNKEEVTIADKILTEDPNHPLLNRAINSLIIYLENAYPCHEMERYPFLVNEQSL